MDRHGKAALLKERGHVRDQCIARLTATRISQERRTAVSTAAWFAADVAALACPACLNALTLMGFDLRLFVNHPEISITALRFAPSRKHTLESRQ